MKLSRLLQRLRSAFETSHRLDQRFNGRQMILAEDSTAEEGQAPKALNVPLITSIAKAWLWQDQLESGKVKSIDEIAAENNVDRTHVSRIMQLTSLTITRSSPCDHR